MSSQECCVDRGQRPARPAESLLTDYIQQEQNTIVNPILTLQCVECQDHHSTAETGTVDTLDLLHFTRYMNTGMSLISTQKFPCHLTAGMHSTVTNR